MHGWIFLKNLGGLIAKADVPHETDMLMRSKIQLSRQLRYNPGARGEQFNTALPSAALLAQQFYKVTDVKYNCLESLRFSQYFSGVHMFIVVTADTCHSV